MLPSRMRFAFHGRIHAPLYLQLSRKRLLRRLRRDPDLLKEYDLTIQQQKRLGIVEVVESPDELSSNRVHYLPIRRLVNCGLYMMPRHVTKVLH